MSYIIALRSRVDESYVGYYDGSSSNWTTDRARAQRFDDEDVARHIADLLRQWFPRVAQYIDVLTESAEEMLAAAAFTSGLVLV